MMDERTFLTHTNKHWRDIKGGGKKAVKCFFFWFFVLHTFPTPPSFISVFVLLTANLMAREKEKGKERNKSIQDVLIWG